MKTVPLFEAKNRLSACARDAQRSPIIITRHGRPYAALVGLDGQDMEAFLVAHHPAIIEAIDRAAEAAKTAGVPLSEVEREVAERERKSRRRRRGRRPAQSRKRRGGVRVK
jgi:prevent-host-death family protein